MEFSLLVECCRGSFAHASGPSIAVDGVDWKRFLALARFHRVEGLAWNALSSTSRVDAGCRDELAAAAAGIAAHNLWATAASRKLHAEFEAAGVPLLFLKGLTLGVLAYGNPALKAAIDIDLLIDPAGLRAAAELLRACGFHLTVPQASENDRLLIRWHRGWKESVWTADSPRLQIDLHTRTADNIRLIPGIDLHSSAQSVDIGGSTRLPTLADEPLFAYLAVHGASSAWFRLKWIADFAALIAGRSRTELESLYRASQELGAGRAAGQALLLADYLFGSLADASGLRNDLLGDRGTRRLFKAAKRLLTREPREPTEKLGGTFIIHWTQLLLLPGAAYQFSEMTRQARRLLKRIG